MAFMVAEGQADIAISEDSDLIAYGCPNVIMKLNPFGVCQQFKFSDFYDFKGESKEVEILQKLNKQDFVKVCIMAGCEYLPNIERVGLKVALKHFGQQGSFEKVISHLQNQATYKDRIPADYIQNAKKVADLFQMQTVYDPKTKCLTQLGGKLTEGLDIEFLGSH